MTEKSVLRVTSRSQRNTDDKSGAELAPGLEDIPILSGLRPDLKQTCEIVLQRGWESIVWQRGFTGLHLAAKQGSEDAVCLLLHATAALALDKEDSKGLRPIDYARKRGFSQLLELLDPARVPQASRSAVGEVLVGGHAERQLGALALSPRGRQGSGSRSDRMSAALDEARATASAQQRRILELEEDLLKERAKVENLQRELDLRGEELALLRASHAAAAPAQGHCDVDLTQGVSWPPFDGIKTRRPTEQGIRTRLNTEIDWSPSDGIKTRRPTEHGIRTRFNTEVDHDNELSADFWGSVLRPSLKVPALFAHRVTFADAVSSSGFLDDGDEEAGSPCNRIEMHDVLNKPERNKFSFDLTQSLTS